MYGLAVYMKEGLPFAWDLFQKTLQILIYVFNWLYFTQCLTSFSSINLSPSSSLCTIFYSISSNIDEVLSVKPSVFGDFNVDHKDWRTYFGGTD